LETEQRLRDLIRSYRWRQQFFRQQAAQEIVATRRVSMRQAEETCREVLWALFQLRSGRSLVA